MPRAAIIEDSTNRVDRIIVVGNTLPPAPTGFSFLREADWAEGQNPREGDIYQGDLPATFVTPTPVDGGDLTTKTPAELLEIAMGVINQQTAVVNELARQLGG